MQKRVNIWVNHHLTSVSHPLLATAMMLPGLWPGAYIKQSQVYKHCRFLGLCMVHGISVFCYFADENLEPSNIEYQNSTLTNIILQHMNYTFTGLTVGRHHWSVYVL